MVGLSSVACLLLIIMGSRRRRRRRGGKMLCPHANIKEQLQKQILSIRNAAKREGEKFSVFTTAAQSIDDGVGVWDSPTLKSVPKDQRHLIFPLSWADKSIFMTF